MRVSRARRGSLAFAALVVALPVSVACHRPSAAPADAAGSASSLVEARPYTLVVPHSIDRARPAPLVVLLHGYGSTGANHAAMWNLADYAERAAFVLATPDGTPDHLGRRFWNATDACCNFDGADVDDVAYVRALIDDASARVKIDQKRVFVLGHSNGGFLAHRLACEMSDRIAAVVSLAGAGWADPSRCRPVSPVSIVQVHGTADSVVRYDGGSVGRGMARHPSARETTRAWSERLGCAGDPERGAATMDLDRDAPGAETRVDRWRGCRAGLELWTIEQGSHVPQMSAAWNDAVWAFFDAHPKP